MERRWLSNCLATCWTGTSASPVESEFWRSIFFRSKLVRLFNACLRFGYISNLWKRSATFQGTKVREWAIRTLTDMPAELGEALWAHCHLSSHVSKEADVYRSVVWWSSFSVDSGFGFNIHVSFAWVMPRICTTLCMMIDIQNSLFFCQI